jgi:sensor domain CHASE-containing protein
VPDQGPADALVARRQLVAVVRLVVDPGGRVVYGALVDPETGRQRRFADARRLGHAFDAWLMEKLQPHTQVDAR